jgi:hypothetical protein
MQLCNRSIRTHCVQSPSTVDVRSIVVSDRRRDDFAVGHLSFSITRIRRLNVLNGSRFVRTRYTETKEKMTCTGIGQRNNVL